MKSLTKLVFRLSGVLFLFAVLINGAPLQAETPLERMVAEAGEPEKSIDITHTKHQTDEFDEYVRDYYVFSYNSEFSNNIREQVPTTLSMTVPTPKGNLNLKLVEHQITTDDFIVESSSGEVTLYGQQGVHYRGTVEGYSGSIAAASFINGQLSVMASTKEYGTVTINKIDNQDQNRYVSYFDADLLIENKFECHAPGANEVPDFIQRGMAQDEFEEQMRGGDVCIKLHFELNHNLFNNRGSIANSVEWMEGVFNVVKLIYEIESLNVAMSYIHVWDTPDPFSGGGASLNELVTYFANGEPMNGDLAHLIGLDGVQLGVAWLTTVCDASPLSTGYDGILASYNDFPLYSWTTLTITHEIGHNLGSPHTSDCVWNGNNTQIDDCLCLDFSCGPCYDPNNPILPAAGGGTIMSYCQNNIGTNPLNGFGPQPGDLIRSVVAILYQP